MKKVFIAAGLIIVIVAAVVIMMTNDSKPSAFAIEDGSLIISGSFGVSVPVNTISDLSLTEISPVIKTKTNGSGVGSICKGEFELQGGAQARLYADISKSPFVVFNSNGTIYYINLATPDETRALYQRLSEEDE